MGVQSMVKHAMGNIKKNNTSNTQTARLWSRRVTDIASDLERSGDTAKKEKFEKLIAAVAAEFEGDDLETRTAPSTFIKRQTAIIQSEAQLDEFKAPPSDRDTVMKEAAKKDMQRLEKNLRDICESSLPLLKELNDILPSKKVIKQAWSVAEEILAENDPFSKLQLAMAQVNNKISNLQYMGYIEPNVMVAIHHLEDPYTQPLHHHCGLEETFGELIQKAFVSKPTGEEGDDDDDDYDDLIPDVWIRKWDNLHNSVTKTGQWWEHQPEHLKLRDVFISSQENVDVAKRQCIIEVVAKKGDYVVALVNDNGVETGKAFELPTSKKRQICADVHFQKHFVNHKVAKVLELQSGKDASQKLFNKLSYRPKTNPLYIELEAWDGQDSAIRSRNPRATAAMPPLLYTTSEVRKIHDRLYYRITNDTSHILLQPADQSTPSSRLLPFLTIPYISAQRILHLARTVHVFHLTSTYIARQALTLVMLLNDSVNADLGPNVEEQSERIIISDELMQLELSMEGWGAALAAHETHDQRIADISQQYRAFFQDRPYYCDTHRSSERILSQLLEHDLQDLKLESQAQRTDLKNIAQTATGTVTLSSVGNTGKRSG